MEAAPAANGGGDPAAPEPPAPAPAAPGKHHKGPKMSIGAKRWRIAIAALIIVALIVGGAVAGEGSLF